MAGLPGLRREILLSLGILVMGAVLALGAAALSASERLMLAQRSVALSQTALALGQALGEARASGGEAGLDRAVEGIARELSLDALVVADPAGRVVASLRPGQRGSRPSDPALALALAKRRLVTPEETEGKSPDPWRSWTFAAPLPGRGPEGLSSSQGAFSVTFPAVDLAWAVRSHRLMIGAFALADLLVILAFGNFLLGRVAVRPLQAVARAARAFSQGDRAVRAPAAGSREVALLAETFNEMADRVEEGRARQQEQLAALTRANFELHAAQEELVKAEKLATVGRLAAGVAHEIGNPLSAILGYAGLLLRENPQGEAGEHLRYIERETERIRRIIRDLLEFSRPGSGPVEELSPAALVEEALDLVRPQGDFRGVRASLEAVPPPGGGSLPPVKGDRHQLTQLLVNLFLNAAQAMEGEGDLTVAVSVREGAPQGGAPPRRRASDPPGGEGRRVRISVRDTGPGLPPEIAGKVFDPFFTTKPPGQGTGLGLALAWGIAAAHGGTLAGGPRGDGARGAEFNLDLPAAG